MFGFDTKFAIAADPKFGIFAVGSVVWARWFGKLIAQLLKFANFGLECLVWDLGFSLATVASAGASASATASISASASASASASSSSNFSLATVAEQR